MLELGQELQHVVWAACRPPTYSDTGSLYPTQVVHLDMDSLVLQNMDELFRSEYSEYGALFTYDWNMARHGKNPPVQGGFLVLVPSVSTFDALVEIVRVGDFQGGRGWGGSGAGAYWG